MRIYVDFDDVVCETAQALCGLAHELFGVRVSYAAIRWFDLRRSFGLDAAQYERLMDRAHEEAAVMNYGPTPGAVETMRRWQDCGWDVSIVTGRPADTREVSRRWLKGHGIGDVPLVFVDKYHREPPPRPGAERALTCEKFCALTFDVAIDDAPVALDLLVANPHTAAFVFDRPWNRDYAPSSGAVERVCDWPALARAVEALGRVRDSSYVEQL